MKCKVCDFSSFEKFFIVNPQNSNELFTYYFCKNCTTGYLFDVDKTNLKQNYDEDYNEYQDLVENKKNIFKSLLEFLYFPRDTYVKNHSKKSSKNILDIGCGNGSFLYSVKNYFNDLYGSDYNKTALNEAKRKIKYLNILPEDLGGVDTVFDVITMWHVLEHIDEPKIFISTIKNLMNYNSKLILEVPNSNSWNLRVFKKNYQWISLPEHLFFYNERSLKELFKGLGFEIISIEYPRMFPLLFSKHFKSLILKILFLPISVLIFILAPYFKASESIRMVVKLKK